MKTRKPKRKPMSAIRRIKLRTRLAHNHFSKAQLGLFVLVFAVVGGYVFYESFATASKIGDIYNDTKVDILDLSMLLSYYNQPATISPGDLNSDGNVNILDLSILLSHYGN